MTDAYRAIRARQWATLVPDPHNASGHTWGCVDCGATSREGVHRPSCPYGEALKQLSVIKHHDNVHICPTCGQDWAVGREADCEDGFHAEANKPEPLDQDRTIL